MARSPDPEQEQLNPPTLLIQLPGAGHTSSAHSSISENHETLQLFIIEPYFLFMILTLLAFLVTFNFHHHKRFAYT